MKQKVKKVPTLSLKQFDLLSNIEMALDSIQELHERLDDAASDLRREIKRANKEGGFSLPVKDIEIGNADSVASDVSDLVESLTDPTSPDDEEAVQKAIKRYRKINGK